ncbi:hypothetical protein [Bdellovibrio sp. HCB209]|uniref:hypothetical protein n=1 Tax=Bdellovibrio sp. HCB209 TaxID=3394354 RepID=UPI0039B5CDE6
MRQRIALILLALLPFCAATAQGSNSSSSNDMKVTLKPEPGYKKQKRVVRTWSVYPTRRVVYDAPQTKGSKTNQQPLLVKTYVDPTQKRMPASVAKPVVAKSSVKPVKPMVAKSAPIKANRAPASVMAAKPAPVVAKKVAAQKPVTAPTSKPTMVASNGKTMVLAPMTFKSSKAKNKIADKSTKRKVAHVSPYEAGMSKVARASSPKKSAGMVGRQKIAYNK